MALGMVSGSNTAGMQEQTIPAYIDMDRLRMEIPTSLIGDEARLKDWVWKHHQDKLMGALNISYDNEYTELQKAKERLKLLDNIATVQRQYLQMAEPRAVFGRLLDNLLELMDSEYGFIGEVKHKEDGAPYLQTHAITNIAWNAATNQFYEENIEHGLKFYNLQSLFGHVLVTATPMIANDPGTHPSACGIPEGHPPLNHFLGIPFFEGHGRKMNGMVGIANKPGGYSEADIDFLEPFTVTCSNLIQAYNAIRENKYLINTLEEKVAERTNELEAANESLEAANRHVMSTSRAQLQHFACMSHEIRTPLNCIMGLSSLLMETQLNAYQADSLKMIVTSGDLLLTVVNDVLDYSKLESGNVDIVMKRSNLQGALDAVVHSIAQKAKLKSLEMKTFYGNDVPEYVETDSRRLQQILYNLLGNAVKFSKELGALELKVDIVNGNLIGEAEADEKKEDTEASNKKKQQPSKEMEISNHGADSEQPNAPKESNLSSESSSRCPFHAVMENDGCDQKTTGTTRKAPVNSSLEPVSKRQLVVSDDSSNSEQKDDQMMESLNASFSRVHTSEDKKSGCPRPSPSSEDDKNECPRSSPSISQSKILRFQVKDYGTGIDKEDFTRIFKPFKQANSYFTEQLYGGTGLGLAITSKLVKGLGGKISVDSVKGEWSEFTVDFPLKGAPSKNNDPSKALKDVTILSVSNNKDAATVESRVFRPNGINFIKLPNMKEIGTYLKGEKLVGSDRFFIFLVQEDLHDPEVLKKLPQKVKSTLLTFGPQYCVKDTERHVRSLSQVLPSVLVQLLCDQVKTSLAKSRGEETKQSEDTTPIEYGEIKILIAEDNIINQKVLKRMLTRLGVTKVDIADNGLKAVEIEARKQDYDIVFMDMQMPIMGGIEACRNIVKRRGENSLPKVVFVTANVSGGFELEAQEAGGDGFISKPFNIKGIENAFRLIKE